MCPNMGVSPACSVVRAAGGQRVPEGHGQAPGQLGGLGGIWKMILKRANSSLEEEDTKVLQSGD